MNEIDAVIAQLERQRDAIERALAALREVGRSPGASSSVVAQPSQLPVKRRRMSPAGRRRIAEAVRKRWADKKAAEAVRAASKEKPKPKKQGITPAGRRRLAEAMRQRWAAKKAAGTAETTKAAKKGAPTKRQVKRRTSKQVETAG